MAIDNRLQVFNEEGQSVDYDILASDVKFLPDGKDLPTKLAELEAHQGDGTVKGVKVGSDTYEPTEGVVDLSTPFNAKVDKVDGKGLSKNDYTDADKAKVDSLKTVATSGSYNDLTDKPVIPEGATPDQSLDPNSDNAVSNAAVCAGLSSKANSSDLQNYATKSELTSGLSGKQNTLTFDDAPGNTDNPVKSRGIKQAIEFVTPTIDENGKWVIGGVTTIHDAHGPMGNITIEDANDMVALIVNDLTTGGQANFLSAEMGKALLSVILQIFGNLGEYAFPNGKPTLNFNTQVSFPISYSQSDQHVTYADGQGGTAPTSVELLGRLEIQLGTDNDLYVINENAVKVFVGGTEVANAYDPTTDKIVIPEVYGNVVIIAQAWTYVGYGESDSPLVSMFDGKNRGNTSGQWVDKIDNSRVLTLSGCTEQSDHVEFDGRDDSALAGSGVGVNIEDISGTIEGVFEVPAISSDNATYPFANFLVSGKRMICISIRNSSSYGVNAGFTQWLSSSDSGVTAGWKLQNYDYKKAHLSMSTERGYLNGVSLARALTDQGYAIGPGLVMSSSARMGIFSFVGSSGTTSYREGKMYCVRIYNKKLTEDEVLQNYKVDKKRFNLS